MDDADLLFELDNDPVVMRYVNGGVPVSRDEIVNETLPAFLSYYERFPGYGFWAAIEKQSGRFLGWFHFRPGPDAGPLEPELGYRLHQAAWNQGFATEGSRALINMGFRGARLRARDRRGDGGQCRVAPGDGEGRAPLRANVPSRLAGPHPRRRTRRRGVRARPSRVGVPVRLCRLNGSCAAPAPSRRSSASYVASSSGAASKGGCW